MTWNHRVMRNVYSFKTKGKTIKRVFYEIREVFYEGGRAYLHTIDGVCPTGESVEELRAELKMMLRATYKPIQRELKGKRRKP